VIIEKLQVLNNRLAVGGILCDLEKAFDCVNPGNVVDKLECYVISEKFPTLIPSYLVWKYQKVFIDKINAYDSVSSGWQI
jgi:hypothetical protein